MITFSSLDFLICDQRSGHKLKISKCLDEGAERYFENFLSNVEDTDLSSFEGERSDSGSTTKPSYAVNNDKAGMHSDLLTAASLPAVTDDVLFPWLQWETSNSLSSSPSKSKTVIKQVFILLSRYWYFILKQKMHWNQIIWNVFLFSFASFLIGFLVEILLLVRLWLDIRLVHQ